MILAFLYFNEGNLVDIVEHGKMIFLKLFYYKEFIMTNLFIIGNGFDLSHDLKTSYKDFYNYLREEYPKANGKNFVQPEVSMMPKGDMVCDETVAVSFLMRIISATSGDEWNDIEATLGILNFAEWFDGDDYENLWDKARRNEDIASSLKVATLKISGYFSEWIDTIKINESIDRKDDFVRIINKDNDLFLSFNYTDTLEKLYGVEEVCHIHGMQGEDILFGHGNDKDDYESNMAAYTGAETFLDEIHEKLRKDTEGAIKENKSFFDDISSVKRIYSYGFSFSDVDKVYIKEICKRLDTQKLTWYLNEFDSPCQRKFYMDTLQECGYNGDFSTFLIEK